MRAPFKPSVNLARDADDKARKDNLDRIKREQGDADKREAKRVAPSKDPVVKALTPAPVAKLT